MNFIGLENPEEDPSALHSDILEAEIFNYTLNKRCSDHRKRGKLLTSHWNTSIKQGFYEYNCIVPTGQTTALSKSSTSQEQYADSGCRDRRYTCAKINVGKSASHSTVQKQIHKSSVGESNRRPKKIYWQ